MHNNIMAAGSRDRPPMLATGRYAQWRSRFLRYIDTRPNGDALRKCILKGPYTPTFVTTPAVPATEDSPAVPEQTTVETVTNMTPENRAHYESEKEAIHLILTGIGDEIYSTVDACQTAQEMWEAIERLQQGESLNIQDVKTNLFWEFGQFTSHDGETIESYYTRFYKMMNEMIRNNLTVATMQVNVQFLQQLQPEWSRFVTIVKQQHKLDEVSYHKLFDILKQYQKEVNELRAERMAKNANPLALVATAQTLQDPYYQSSKSHKSYAPTSKASLPTRSHATTRYKGKEIAKPITPPSESASEEDSDPEQAQKDKDMQKKNMHENLGSHCKGSKCVVARDTEVVQYAKVGIHALTAGIWSLCQVNAESQERVRLHDHKDKKFASLDVRWTTKKIQKQLKKANATLTQELTECKSILAETSRTLGESNSIRDSCLVALQNKQTEFERYKAFNDRTVDYDKLERKLNETLGLLAQKDIDIQEGLKVKAYEISVVQAKHDELVKQSLLTRSHYEGLVKEKTKVITDLKLKEEKDIDKMISMEHQLKFLNEIVYKRSQSIQTIHMLAPKCPTFNGRPTFANPMYLKKAQYEHPVMECDCLAQKLSEQTDFVSKEIYTELLQRFARLEKHSISLEIALQECQVQLKNDTVCKERASSISKRTEHYVEIQEFESSMQDKNLAIRFKTISFRKTGLFLFRRLLLREKYFAKKKSVPKTNESEGLSKPVTLQNLPKTAMQAVRNTNVIKPGMYRIASSTTQTRAPQLNQTFRNTNPRASTSTGVAHKTNVSRPQPRSNQMKDKVVPYTSHASIRRRKMLYKKTSKAWKWWIAQQCPSTYKWVPKTQKKWVPKTQKKWVPKTQNKWVPKVRNESVPKRVSFAIVQLILFIVDSGCTKHMTGNVSLLCNFVEKYLGTVRFGNDQFAPILGYGDLVQGNITIKRVYYVEGLNHNLFSVGQFCDADLEVAFRKSTCFVRDLQGNDLLSGNRGSDLYTISLQETTSSTPNCLPG
ncbi:hypothetical protein Tco_1456875 [Tanacetum coccineum]